MADQLGNHIHYYRYCDDMILLTRRESHCQQVFQAYLNAIEDLKLPYHEPTTVEKYDITVWRAKSKNPYCWTGRKESNCVPWVQFVGYQLRYDGLVRIKKKSLEKQLMKIRNATDRMKFGLGCRPGKHTIAAPPSVPANSDQVLLSLRSRLIQMGVGKVQLKRFDQGPRPLCWAGGYKALDGKPLVPGFLKSLDRQREKQIRRMDQARIAYGGAGTSSKRGGKGQRPNPIGFLFSYMAQFHSAGGIELINSPHRPWRKRFIKHPLFLLRHHKMLTLLRSMVARWLGRLVGRSRGVMRKNLISCAQDEQ